MGRSVAREQAKTESGPAMLLKKWRSSGAVTVRGMLETRMVGFAFLAAMPARPPPAASSGQGVDAGTAVSGLLVKLDKDLTYPAFKLTISIHKAG